MPANDPHHDAGDGELHGNRFDAGADAVSPMNEGKPRRRARSRRIRAAHPEGGFAAGSPLASLHGDGAHPTRRSGHGRIDRPAAYGTPSAQHRHFSLQLQSLHRRMLHATASRRCIRMCRRILSRLFWHLFGRTGA